MPAGGSIDLALHHRDALPVERLEQRVGLPAQFVGYGDALAVDADTAGRRLLAQPAMRERRAQAPVPAQREDALGGAHDALLHERGIRAARQGADRRAQRVGGGDELDIELAPAAGPVDHDRAVRLQDGREGDRRQHAVQVIGVLELYGHRHVEPGRARHLEHAGLVAAAPEGHGLRQRHRDGGRQEIPVREHGRGRCIRHGQEHVDAEPHRRDPDFGGIRSGSEQRRRADDGASHAARDARERVRPRSRGPDLMSRRDQRPRGRERCARVAVGHQDARGCSCHAPHHAATVRQRRRVATSRPTMLPRDT